MFTLTFQLSVSKWRNSFATNINNFSEWNCCWLRVFQFEFKKKIKANLWLTYKFGSRLKDGTKLMKFCWVRYYQDKISTTKYFRKNITERKKYFNFKIYIYLWLMLFSDKAGNHRVPTYRLWKCWHLEDTTDYLCFWLSYCHKNQYS